MWSSSLLLYQRIQLFIVFDECQLQKHTAWATSDLNFQWINNQTCKGPINMGNSPPPPSPPPSSSWGIRKKMIGISTLILLNQCLKHMIFLITHNHTHTDTHLHTHTHTHTQSVNPGRGFLQSQYWFIDQWQTKLNSTVILNGWCLTNAETALQNSSVHGETIQQNHTVNYLKSYYKQIHDAKLGKLLTGQNASDFCFWSTYYI